MLVKISFLVNSWKRTLIFYWLHLALSTIVVFVGVATKK